MNTHDFQEASESSWEKQKFEREIILKEKEIWLSEKRLKADNRRNLLIGAMVPMIVALMTAVPAWIASKNQRALQEATFEAQLVTDSVKTGDPDQAAVNLSFLLDSGLLSGETGDRVRVYLEERKPGTGRSLPAN